MAIAHDHPQGGLDLGYPRISTTEQSLERQLDALTAAGIPIERIHPNKKTGISVERPGMTKVLEHAIVVHTLDRLDRNLREIFNLIHDLAERGISVLSLADPLPSNTTDEGMGRIAFLLLALFAGMERTFGAERAGHSAVAEAKNRHPTPGGPPAEKVEYARLLKARGGSLGQIATKAGIPKISLHRYLSGDEQPGCGDHREGVAPDFRPLVLTGRPAGDG
jgi:DNA invertase Pin-like site-specific DNA recombinase